MGHPRSMKKLLLYTLITTSTITSAALPVAAQNCTVQKGESIYRIAKEYHLEFSKLLKLNKHLANPNLIHPGDAIETHADSGDGVDGHAGTGTSTTTTDTSASEYAKEVLRLVNEARAREGVEALTLDATLNKVAQTKAADMAENNYFSHDSPTYGTPFELMRSMGVTGYQRAGENIAAGQPTPAAVMESWTNSSGHRANILNAGYNRLGVGYVKGGSMGTYWVQEFTQQ